MPFLESRLVHKSTYTYRSFSCIRLEVRVWPCAAMSSQASITTLTAQVAVLTTQVADLQAEVCRLTRKLAAEIERCEKARRRAANLRRALNNLAVAAASVVSDSD